jgi:hypothetical protein
MYDLKMYIKGNQVARQTNWRGMTLTIKRLVTLR